MAPARPAGSPWAADFDAFARNFVVIGISLTTIGKYARCSDVGAAAAIV